jgi:hypothetical protein
MMPRFGQQPEASKTFGNLEEPYDHGEESTEAYLLKASLSPWVPVSDVVARKMFDLAQATATDVHVDLGSGDGRVNFHAIDYGVKKSTGIDVDEKIVEVARQRLARRHPPPDLEFVVADLLDEAHPAWEKVQEATIITMYFAEEGLKAFRPVLESKLVGRRCKVITTAYEMPGWQSRIDEVVLGTGLHLYEWGADDDDDDEDWDFVGDDFAEGGLPMRVMQNPMESSKFRGSNVIDHTGKYPIRGFNPDLFFEEEGDEDWDAESSEDEEGG